MIILDKRIVDAFPEEFRDQYLKNLEQHKKRLKKEKEENGLRIIFLTLSTQ